MRGVVGAALLDGLDGELERGLGVADAGAGQTVGAERGQRHAEHGIGIAPRAREIRRRRGCRTCRARDARGRRPRWRGPTWSRCCACRAPASRRRSRTRRAAPGTCGDRRRARRRARSPPACSRSAGSTPLEKFQKPLIDEAAVDPPAAPLRDRRCRRRSARRDPGPRPPAGRARRRAPASSDGSRGWRRSSRWRRSRARPRRERRTSPTNGSSMPPQRLGWWKRKRPAGAGRPASPSPSGARSPRRSARSRSVGTSARGAAHRLVVADLGEAASGHARIPAVCGIAVCGIFE